MLSASESREALALVASSAVRDSVSLLSATGSASARRALLLEGVPEIISYYSDGSSALAADFYDDQREIAAPPRLYLAEPVVVDRGEKIGRAVAWATAPLADEALDVVQSRLSSVTQLYSARPFRDTILENRKRDPSAVGWRRVTSGGCKFCRMLADRGAVFIEATARFAAHPNCNCSAQPVFSSEDYGEEASALQYIASTRKRSPAQKAIVRDYLNTNYSDFPG